MLKAYRYAAVNISARNEPLDANVSGVALCVV
jgi:hypothetical protein